MQPSILNDRCLSRHLRLEVRIENLSERGGQVNASHTLDCEIDPSEQAEAQLPSNLRGACLVHRVAPLDPPQRFIERCLHGVDVLETIAGLPAVSFEKLPTSLDALRRESALIALPLEDGSCLVPSFQLERDRSRQQAVAALNRSLRASDLPWDAAFWWTIPQADLAGLSPIAYLDLFPLDAATDFQTLRVA